MTLTQLCLGIKWVVAKVKVALDFDMSLNGPGELFWTPLCHLVHHAHKVIGRPDGGCVKYEWYWSPQLL